MEEVKKVTMREYALKHRKCGMCGAALINPNDWGNPHATEAKTWCVLRDPLCDHWDCKGHSIEDDVR